MSSKLSYPSLAPDSYKAGAADEPDAYAHYTRHLVKSYIDEHFGNQTGLGSPIPWPIEGEIGILGAGPGGLYSAMLINCMNKYCRNLDGYEPIKYKILEARGRVGGRLYTHSFSNTQGAPYNYYDVGAMRWPKTTAMARVFSLFEYLEDGKWAKEHLIRFIFKTGRAFLSFNGVTVRQDDDNPPGTFHDAELMPHVKERDRYIKAGADNIINDVIAPYADELLKDLEDPEGRKDKDGVPIGWKKLMEVDDYSARGYMATKYIPTLDIPKKPLPSEVINWMEIFDKSTGWYDRAFSETVLEAIAFGYEPKEKKDDTKKDEDVNAKWFCINGGSDQLAQAMYRDILEDTGEDPFRFNSEVTAIACVGINVVQVTVNDEDKPYEFAAIICTIPLPVLRTIDLENAGVSVAHKAAINGLDYGPSVKIGMQFRTDWWTTKCGIVGGQTYTDSPLRTIVYPSFGREVDGEKFKPSATTLIASYCWTEDADRLTGLVGKDPEALKEFTLKELARIHKLKVDYLRDQLIDYFPWSWLLDKNTMGAFAFFGPGKFKTSYNVIRCPTGTNNRILFAGEALSPRHAWVEGALDSAAHAVALLFGECGNVEIKDNFIKYCGQNPEWIDYKEGKPNHVFDPATSLVLKLVTLTLNGAGLVSQ